MKNLCLFLLLAAFTVGCSDSPKPATTPAKTTTPPAGAPKTTPPATGTTTPAKDSKAP